MEGAVFAKPTAIKRATTASVSRSALPDDLQGRGATKAVAMGKEKAGGRQGG
jgi:hypothetical protein